MSTQVTNEALASVLGGLASALRSEQEKSEPFKAMFREGSTFTGLLRHLEMQGMGAALDACAVLEKRHEVWISHPVMEFLLALPYLSYKLEKQIQSESGICCCVDKSFHLLSEELKRLIEANPKPGQEAGK